MKKVLLFCLSLLMAMSQAFAGGLVHNTNQSAAWARTLSRDAVTDVTAAYYNPAGLTKLPDGLHLSISNQSIFQKRTLDNSYQFLNEGKFEGSVDAPIYPNIYAVYKTGKLAFSLGFTPIGGGGSAVFDKGVPMIEQPVSNLVPSFNSSGVTGYSLNTNFEGSSIYFGIQGGVSYEINEMISVFAGARYVWAKNTYKGALKDVTVTTANGDIPAGTYLNGVASQLTALSTTHESLSAIINGGGGSLTFAQAEGTIISAEQRAGIEAGLLTLGYTQTQIDALTINDAQPIYLAASPVFANQAATVGVTALLMADQEADVTQTGNGITPIIGANISLMEDKLNIGLKYEFKTEMEVTNETPSGMGFTNGFDPATMTTTEMFPDGAITNADIPALLTIGAKYKITDALTANAGFHYFFDKNTGWKKTRNDIEYGTEDLIKDNSFEASFALEYNITDQILISAGYLRAGTGVEGILYNNDLTYSISSNTFGFGGAYKINNQLTLQLGAYFTAYENSNLNYTDGVTSISYTQEYDKKVTAFGIGLDFAFGGGE